MRWDEETAKKEKVCPMTMTFEAGRFQSKNCIGSKCMGWRGSLGSEIHFQPPSIEKMGVKEEGKKEKGEMKITTEPGGYCGMAGPPEKEA
jgi:hypothetical protein